MSITEYDFLEGYRIEISWRDIGIHTDMHLLGYCPQVEHLNSSNLRIYVILDSGEVEWMIPVHKDVKNVKINILDWDPKNPPGKKSFVEEDDRFKLMDFE